MYFKRVIIALSVTGLAAAFSLGLFTRPVVKGTDSAGFSAVRVAADIEVISREPHSLENPKARAKVRDYLVQRLTEIGFSVEVKHYDSVRMRSGEYTSIANIHATAMPLKGKPGSFLLMIAHYDSRHTFRAGEEVHYSLGAADDGYGLGVILESAYLAMKYRQEWRQGFRIIFTDAEENNLDGIKKAIEYEPMFFSDAGLAINLEARGVKGPAILFETSAGNSELTELYGKADYPYSYSLTTAIYKSLPNDTDFSPVKKIVPGFNFSVIDNLDFYHTKHDNYSNISLSSIQHYGSQIEPVVEEYLKGERYSDSSLLKGAEDLVYFTVPFLGIISFTAGSYMFVNILMLILFAASLLYAFRAKRVSLKGYTRGLILIIFLTLALSLLSYAGTRILCALNGADYRMISLAHLKYDEIYNIAVISLIFPVVYLTNSLMIRKQILSNLEIAIASQSILSLTAYLLLIQTGENFFIIVPLSVSLLTFIGGDDHFARLVSLPGIFLSVITVTPFIYSIHVALASGALFIPVFYTALLAFSLMPAAYTFTRKIAKSN